MRLFINVTLLLVIYFLTLKRNEAIELRNGSAVHAAKKKRKKDKDNGLVTIYIIRNIICFSFVNNISCNC